MSDQTAETTDSWPIGKIIKHVLLPKPKGSPKAGAKEILVRVLFAGVIGVSVYWFGFRDQYRLPGCDAAETKTLVYDIARKKFIEDKKVDPRLFGVDLVPNTYALDVIRVKGQDPQTKAYSCAADLKMTLRYSNGTQAPISLPVTYTIENTTKTGEFYVTVEGL